MQLQLSSGLSIAKAGLRNRIRISSCGYMTQSHPCWICCMSFHTMNFRADWLSEHSSASLTSNKPMSKFVHMYIKILVTETYINPEYVLLQFSGFNLFFLDDQ